MLRVTKPAIWVATVFRMMTGVSSTEPVVIKLILKSDMDDAQEPVMSEFSSDVIHNCDIFEMHRYIFFSFLFLIDKMQSF